MDFDSCFGCVIHETIEVKVRKSRPPSVSLGVFRVQVSGGGIKY